MNAGMLGAVLLLPHSCLAYGAVSRALCAPGVVLAKARRALTFTAIGWSCRVLAAQEVPGAARTPLPPRPLQDRCAGGKSSTHLASHGPSGSEHA
jgi:hypothetical protein